MLGHWLRTTWKKVLHLDAGVDLEGAIAGHCWLSTVLEAGSFLKRGVSHTTYSCHGPHQPPDHSVLACPQSGYSAPQNCLGFLDDSLRCSLSMSVYTLNFFSLKYVLCLECFSLRHSNDELSHLLQVSAHLSPYQRVLLWLSKRATPSQSLFPFLALFFSIELTLYDYKVVSVFTTCLLWLEYYWCQVKKEQGHLLLYPWCLH